MQALVKAAPAPGALELRDVPAPRPRAGEVLVSVASASICGGDLHMAEWHPLARVELAPRLTPWAAHIGKSSLHTTH
jgi:threonine dehydrogenase-like Zn-dependent dehydrogenase